MAYRTPAIASRSRHAWVSWRQSLTEVATGATNERNAATVRWIDRYECEASETRALLLSTVCALVMGAIAIFVALATGSGAILLDGAFNLCFFATALVTLR